MSSVEQATGRVTAALRNLFRDPNPILVKELRATFRTNLFIRFLYLSTGVVGIVVLAGGAAVAAGPLPPAEVGQIVFQIFFSTALFVICLVAPAYASTALTSEREQRTYESLILSGMKPWRIVRGKYLAAFASMFLVLVALAPVVGIAFLFGGVSPSHVVVGYGGLMLVLGLAIALGVAISARLSSTRIAILIATLVFVPSSLFATISLAAVGELARQEWGIGMQGPFWFTEALISRITEWDTLGLLVALPLYLFGMPIWFLLASAVAGVRPPAEDRSTPFKIWSAAAALGMVVIVGLLITLFGDGRGAAKAGLLFVGMSGMALLFYATLFMNEPPLPPRLAARRHALSPLRLLYWTFGPGAAGTLRFAALLLVVTSFALSGAAVLVRHVMYPGFAEHGQADVGLFVLAAGNAAVAVFTVSLGTWLRTVLHNGIAARVLAMAAFAALCIVPFLMALIIDPSSLDRMEDAIPLLVQLSPVMPTILAVNVAEGDLGLGAAGLVMVPVVVYGLGAALFWVLTEVSVRRAKAAEKARRERREQRVRTSEPPVPLLQRESVPSQEPLSQEEEPDVPQEAPS